MAFLAKSYQKLWAIRVHTSCGRLYLLISRQKVSVHELVLPGRSVHKPYQVVQQPGRGFPEEFSRHRQVHGLTIFACAMAFSHHFGALIGQVLAGLNGLCSESLVDVIQEVELLLMQLGSLGVGAPVFPAEVENSAWISFISCLLPKKLSVVDCFKLYVFGGGRV